jgi:hypothetical protein
MNHTPQENDIPQASSLGPRQRPLLGRAAFVAAGILALGIAVAGCGGDSSTPGVATGSTTTTAVGPPAVGSTEATGLLAYASCMRSQGVPGFPDPTSSGGIPKNAVVSAFQAVSRSRAGAAQNACRHLLAAGGSLSGKAVQTITAQERQDYLEAAACMRAHGFPDFPDPTFESNSVQTSVPSSINQNASRFTSAATICTKLIPEGLPYSRPSGS